jgi:hypothetical protein
MPKSYRIRTSVGNSTQSDKTIKVQVDQDFDFLEILSLKLTQSDVYRSFCSDYGVVVGRVIANGGYGVPNAKVSVFVPIDAVDQNDPVISALYPYKNVTDKNEDGYRYNLLPYTPSYEGHAATGTFPTREDVLTRTEVLQIYEKYYKYTVKTNESGDYMIVGVPLGNQQVILDVDLSDMGCFSLRPTDLIRMNLGNPKQFDGNQFKTSADLSSLPQIVNQRKSISVSSFWGTGDICDVGITRVDFDLRDSNITIEPTATFMGSIMTSNDSVILKNNCKPSSEQGDLCGMVAGPGRILAVRQTINTNLNGDPILEQYQLEQGGKVIDENGAFVVDVPMNLDYVTTNEFGELIFSNNPSVGIPTKGKYRFKVKTNEGEKEVGAIQTSSSIIGPNLLNLSAFNPKGSLLRGNFLVPNVKEYGWDNGTDPSTLSNTTEFSPIFGDETKLIETKTFTSSDFGSGGRALLISSVLGEYKSISYKINNIVDNSKWVDLPNGNETLEITVEKKTTTDVVNGVVIETPQTVTLNFNNYNYKFSLFQRSYAFSLDWDDYPNKNEAISCQDFFYEFNYNKVYTTAQLIDEYRKGTNRSRFLSIKEILDRSCDSEVNKFPINDGVRNFDLLYFIVSILFQILGITGALIIIIYHIVKFLWNNFAPYLLILLMGLFTYLAYQEGVAAVAGYPAFGAMVTAGLKSLAYLALVVTMGIFFKQLIDVVFPSFKLPMITYPDCSTCDCGETQISTKVRSDSPNTSPLADINSSNAYVNKDNPDDDNLIAIENGGYGQVMAGNGTVEKTNYARTPFYNNPNNDFFWSRNDLPIPERINLYNTKSHYFTKTAGGGTNRIKVYPNYTANTINNINNEWKFYEDMPMVFLMDSDQLKNFTTGKLFTFMNPATTSDVNTSATTSTNELKLNTKTGTTIPYGNNIINIPYADPDNQDTLISYKDFKIVQNSYISGVTSYAFASDVEYLQVVTAVTVNTVLSLTNNKTLSDSSFVSRVINGTMTIFSKMDDRNPIEKRPPELISPLSKFENYQNLVVVIAMKGVDPYSSRQTTKIDISLPLGLNYGELVVESNYKLNIPIQEGLVLPRHNQLTNNNSSTNLFYPSYTFTPSVGNGEFDYVPYKTKKHLYFSNLDSTTNVRFKNATPGYGKIVGGYLVVAESPGPIFGGLCFGNDFVKNNKNGYYLNEYVEGGSIMYSCHNLDPNVYDAGGNDYVSEHYNLTANELNMSNSTNIVMRADRLPTSENIDNRFVFAQNKTFSTYIVEDSGNVLNVGATISNASDFNLNNNGDMIDSYGTGTTSVMSSFNCNTIVPLGAYTQTAGKGMTVKPKEDSVYYTGGDKKYPIVTNGCYTLVAKDLAISDDLKSFAEWKSRFLMGFAICRNVFGMTFTNNWINGVLYMPGFQNDKIYPGIEVTNPTYLYCKEKIVFKEENNSFFYRSSPFNQNTGQFIGMRNTQVADNFGNQYFLGNPTTIVDLGPKDNIIKNVCAQPEFQGYVADRLKATSFQGVSDLIQYFIISRLSNADFLERLLSLGDSSISELFSRPAQKIDGDFAQLNSINNEIGVIPFSPESYSEGNLFYGATPKPVVGVFFSSDTVTRDYISPGREIFVDTITKFGYNTFGHKTQIVPMYKWEIKQGNAPVPSIFGSESNNWATQQSDFYITPYQSIDRLNDSTYFASSETHPTVQRPGYIYNSSQSKDSNGNVIGFTYNGFLTTSSNNKFIVGAPYHFYFGLKKGKTAFDIFVTKNLINI